MAEEKDSIAGYLAQMNALLSSAGNIQNMLQRITEELSRNGINLNIDLVDIVSGFRRDLSQATSTSEKLVTQLREYQALAHTAAVVNSTLNLDAVLTEVMDTLVDMTGAERAYLMLRNDRTGEMSVRAARNWDRESIGEADKGISSSIVDKVLATGEAIVTTNAQADNRFSAQESVVNYQLRSLLCVPMTKRDKIVGVIYADNRVFSGVFKEETAKLVKAFSNQAAIAIDNAQLYGRVKADLDEANRQVAELKIQIDVERRQKQVEAITDTDFFQQLRHKADTLRGERQNREEGNNT